MRNAFTERWDGHEAELATDTPAREALKKAVSAEDYGVAHIYAGESVGLVERVEPAAEIVRRLETGAQARLRALTRLLR